MFNFVYSFITFIIALFFTLFGFFSILTSLVFHIRITFANFILNNPLLLFIFGLCLFACGLALITYILLTSRKKVIVIRTGKNAVSVDEALVQSYLNAYWAKLFPNHDVASYIIVKKNLITIVANLPSVDYEDQKLLLERIESDIQEIFKDIIGHQDEIELDLSFQKNSEP